MDRNTPFGRFAIPNILGEMRRHFRDTSWAAHVPRGMQERTLDVRRAVNGLSQGLGRSPTPGEVADELGISTEEVLDVMEAMTAHTAASLDAPRPSQDGDRETYVHSLGGDDQRYALVEDLATVLPAMRVLPEREREIIRLRFGESLTQSQIAQRLGISQMHVSRLLRRALDRVRTVAASERQRQPGRSVVTASANLTRSAALEGPPPRPEQASGLQCRHGMAGAPPR